MTNTKKTDYALREEGSQVIEYAEGSESGIKKVKTSYEFVNSNTLLVSPKVKGKGCKVAQIGIYDVSKIFISSSGLSEEQQQEAIRNEIKSGKPLWLSEVESDEPPYQCDLEGNFDGIAMLIAVVVINAKKEYWVHPFTFISDTLSPAVTFVLGFGSEFVVARYKGEYRILEKFYAVRLQSGEWTRAGCAEESEKKIADEDLEFIAMCCDQFAILKQTYKSEKTIGKEYLDEMFDDMEKRGESAVAIVINPFIFSIFEKIYNIEKFFLPNPGESWRTASDLFEKMLAPETSAGGRVLAGLGYLFFGAMVLVEVLPSGKVVKKAGKIIDRIRGIEKGAKEIEKVKDVTKKTKKVVEEVVEEVGDDVVDFNKRLEKAAESRQLTGIEKSVQTLEAAKEECDVAINQIDQITKQLEKAAESHPKLLSQIERSVERNKQARKAFEKIKEGIGEGFQEFTKDIQTKILQEVMALEDITKLLEHFASLKTAVTLRTICQITKGWSRRRKWKAFIEWIKFQRMSGKATQVVDIGEGLLEIIREGEKFTDKAFFNLKPKRVRAVFRRIAKGATKVCSKGISRKEMNTFKQALEKAYADLPKAQRKFITGIEFSGKSAKGFMDEGVKWLNDIDCTIFPIDPKGLADRKAREAFCKLVDKHFKELTEGISLAEKDIYIYTEWGKGAFNKADEGWPPMMRHVYEKVENKAISTFDKLGKMIKSELRNEDIIARLPTLEEAEFFCKYALKEFLKTVKKGNPNVKWMHKADLVIEKAGLAVKYSDEDKKLIEKMRQIFVRDPNEIQAGEELLVNEAIEFLKKYGGDLEAAVSPIRYIFLFTNRLEAKVAYAYAKKLPLVVKVIKILYVERRSETPKRPAMKTIKVLKTDKT